MQQPLRRKQILISAEQDRYLASRARAEGRSESALVRELIDRFRSSGPAVGPDPIDHLIGAFSGRPAGSHDEILYGRPRKRGRKPSSS